MSELSGLARKRGIWSLRRRRSRLSLSVKRPLDADSLLNELSGMGCAHGTPLLSAGGPVTAWSCPAQVSTWLGVCMVSTLRVWTGSVHISWKPAAMDSQAPSPLSNAS